MRVAAAALLLLAPGATAFLTPSSARRTTTLHAGLVAPSELPEERVFALLDAADASRSTADAALESLKARGAAPRFRSAELQPAYAVSLAQLRTTTRCDGELADAVGALGGQSVEKLAVLFAGVFLSSILSAVASMQFLTFLPEILRFTVVQLFCFAPYGYLTLGLTLPEELQRFATRLYVSLFPAYRARLIRHEAGHLVVGHALGLPVKKVEANAAAAAVSFHDLRVEDARALRLPADAAARRPPRFGPADSADALAIVSLSGIMAEIDEYGDSEGGAADLAQLQAIFDGYRFSEDAAVGTTRWAALQAHLILKREATAVEAVVAYLKDCDDRAADPVLSECVRALEGAPTDAREAGPMRRANRVEPGLFERLLVKPPRGNRDAPVEYDRSEAWTVPWEEDDVLSLALVVTGAFLWYALAHGI